MGYRQYFEKVKKEKIQEIKDLDLQGLIEYAKRKNIEVDDENNHIFFLDILKTLGGIEVFGFGKYYENAEELCKLGEPVFNNKSVQEQYDDYYPYVVGKEAVTCAIEWQRKKILNYFQDLLLSDEEHKKNHPFDKRTRQERIEEEIRDKVIEWESTWITPYNIENEENNRIVNSWLYEYTIFDLVRIYRDTDWNTECLIFYGY